MKEENLIILFSGGADSTLLVKLAIAMGYSPFCIGINYGQRHIDELGIARKFCKENELQFMEIHVENLNVHSALKDGVRQYEGVSEWHVPSRNMLFVSLAASYAESMGIKKIWYGANYVDREHLFPDCYQEWVYKMNELLKINGSTQIILEAPLLGFSKEMIVSFLKIYGININQTFSGYGKEENN